jgi:hypothetical protein
MVQAANLRNRDDLALRRGLMGTSEPAEASVQVVELDHEEPYSVAFSRQ